ncbi:hypothetical protein B0T14DRAFT_549125 [Immersiella caudata]|uniref:F-box domain-containing protein n=1 Tax=Immersiella caudata TaxID=314043 RepID=A0AA40CBA5_9PEZI|nr:hypothetical protein B0T14DRAFT_549125 [Immersiella caudata]
MCIPKQIFHPVDERRLLSPEDQSQQPYHTNTIPDIGTLLCTATFHPEDNRTGYAEFNSSLSSPVCYFFLSSFLRSPTSNLGTLSIFPIETLQHIIQYLPIRTLLHLRHVNQRFREVVSSLPLYELLATHATIALIACMRFGVLGKTTLHTVYDLATIQTCHLCGEFGQYVFMPTLQRCCRRCISPYSNPDFHLLRVTAEQKKALSRYENDRFWIVRSVPRAYSADRHTNVGDGKRRGVFARKSWLVSKTRVPEGVPVEVAPTTGGGNVDQLKCDLCYMCLVLIPPLEVDGREVREQMGVQCKGCERNWTREIAKAVGAGHMPHCGSPIKELVDRVYSRRGFMKHFVWCRRAQEFWMAERLEREEEKGKGLGQFAVEIHKGVVAASG